VILIAITSSCANENLRSRVTLRKEGEVALLESPNGLDATSDCQADKLTSITIVEHYCHAPRFAAFAWASSSAKRAKYLRESRPSGNGVRVPFAPDPRSQAARSSRARPQSSQPRNTGAACSGLARLASARWANSRNVLIMDGGHDDGNSAFTSKGPGEKVPFLRGRILNQIFFKKRFAISIELVEY